MDSPPAAGRQRYTHQCPPLHRKGNDGLKMTFIGTIGLGVISYAGGICISVATDKVLGTEGTANRICQRFEKRFALYVARAKQILEHEE
jgi:hypothetical protein